MKSLRFASCTRLLPALVGAGLFLTAGLFIGGCNSGPRSSAPTPAASSVAKATPPPAASGYRFEGGFPTEDTRLRAEDDSFVAHAIELYGRFLPTLATHAAHLECERVGAPANRGGALLLGNPRQRLLAPSLDVPSGLIAIDLEAGPVVLEVPVGSVTALINDQHQRPVFEHAGTAPGGATTKYFLARADRPAPVPPGHRGITLRTRRALVLLRALPVEGSLVDAEARLRAVTVHEVNTKDAPAMHWVLLGVKTADFTPVRWEKSLDYWRELHEVLSAEIAPATTRPRDAHSSEDATLAGELAHIGIHPGEPFAPSEREKSLLIEAARLASDRLRVRAFADHSTGALVWTDRQWEWLSPASTPGAPGAALTFDRRAQEKWAFQAAFLAPSLIGDTLGSFDWFTSTDRNGTFLEGSNTYRLKVPLPVPAKFFWSITLHDPVTRSELPTKHKRATLRSFAELLDLGTGDSAEIYFGPLTPPGQDRRWIQTVPEQGFVVHFRLHQPATDTLESTWQLGDLEAI